jgi:hypothetical protein
MVSGDENQGRMVWKRLRAIISGNRADLPQSKEKSSRVNQSNCAGYTFIGWQKPKLKYIESGNLLPVLSGHLRGVEVALDWRRFSAECKNKTGSLLERECISRLRWQEQYQFALAGESPECASIESR